MEGTIGGEEEQKRAARIRLLWSAANRWRDVEEVPEADRATLRWLSYIGHVQICELPPAVAVFAQPGESRESIRARLDALPPQPPRLQWRTTPAGRAWLRQALGLAEPAELTKEVAAPAEEAPQRDQQPVEAPQPVIKTPNHARDRRAYELARRGKPWKEVQVEINRMAAVRGWERWETPQAAMVAVKRHIKRHNLPAIEPRKIGRPRQFKNRHKM